MDMVEYINKESKCVNMYRIPSRNADPANLSKAVNLGGLTFVAVNSLMIVGINVCVFDTKLCSQPQGLIL